MDTVAETFWLPASELFPDLEVGEWFELEGAPRNKFQKRNTVYADRYARAEGVWSWQGTTGVGANYVASGDVECRIRPCGRPF